MPSINRNNISSAPAQSQSQGEGRNGGGWGLGLSSRNRTGPWEPTVVYLLLLIVLEYAAFIGLRYTFRGTHGG
jgi:hypothetical protein